MGGSFFRVEPFYVHLANKKKEVEQAQGGLSRVMEELDEVTQIHKKEIAMDLYHAISTD